MRTHKRAILLAISLLFTFVFGLICPTWATITPAGVKLLGALIGWLILAASGFGLLIPSLIAMVATQLTGYYTAADIFAKGIGSSFNVLVILIFVLVEVFSSSKTGEYVVRWFLSRKFINGRPYVLTATFLVTMVILGSILGSFGILMIAIVVLNNISTVSGVEKTDDWVRFLLISVVALSGVTEVLFPFKAYAQMYIGIFNSSLATVNASISESIYLLTGVILAIIAIVLLMLIARFFFHFNFDKLRLLDVSLLRTGEFSKITKPQTVILITVLLAFFYPALILLFPADSAVFATLNGLGQPLFMALCIAFLSIVKIDGQPMMEPAKAFAKGVNWDIVFGIACVTLLGGALGAEDTGFTPWLLSIFTDLFSQIGFVPILILTALISCVLTQFFSNTASGMIMCSVIAPLSILLASRGVNISVFPAVIGIGTLSACLIPAGSGQAAIMLSTDIFKGGAGWAIKNGLIVLAAITVSCALSGIIVGSLL